MASDIQTTLVKDLAHRIRRRIQESDLVDGALFMTEAEVASQYEVSRTVAREAVGRLKALGILEGRKRKGLIVRRPDPLRLLIQTLPSLATSDVDLRELSMLRFVIEVGAIELVVRNATEKQIEDLGHLVSQMEVALRDTEQWDRFVELDLRFHAAILGMSGSRLIAGMRQVLVDFFGKATAQSTVLEAADRILWEHRELHSAIRDRDIERARTMTRMHSGHWLDVVAAVD